MSFILVAKFFGASSCLRSHLSISKFINYQWPATCSTTSLSVPIPTTVPTSIGGLILSLVAAPFPHKLVDKDRSGQFVEMREPLADNISLIQQLEVIQGPTSISMIGPTRPRVSEVSALPTWLYCFLAYTAIATNDPTTRNQLAYARLIMGEALCHGNSGWLDYYRSFRQQAAAECSLQWNTSLSGLQASMTPPGWATLTNDKHAPSEGGRPHPQ